MRITVVGGGRMGLPLACVFAKHGAHVTVADVDPYIVEHINEGTSPYEEPGLADLMVELHGAHRLSATTDTRDASSRSEAIVVIVPAHLTPDREIDFHILNAASVEVGRGLRKGSLVVYETTVSVGGTRRNLVPVLERNSNMTAGTDFHVGFSPERVKANLVLERLETTPKVVGGFDDTSRAKTVALYRRYLAAPIADVGSLEAAEMTKLMGMLYRDVNIALANELAAFCEISGVDFDLVRNAANSDGEGSLLHPGIGVGGHCTPVYPYFLTRESRRRGLPQRISEAAREINDAQPARQVDRVTRHWHELADVRVHILGLAFRPGVKVDTFSPAFALRAHLQSLGANVTIEDPYFSHDEIARLGFVHGSVQDAKLVILNTAHEQFAAPDFRSWRDAGIEVLLDGRNLWDRTAAESAGLLYFGIGKSATAERLG